MKVIMCTFQSVSLYKGGVRTQLYKTAEYLREFVEVDFFNQWEDYNNGKESIFHIFTASNRTYFLAEALNRRGFNIVTSPIYYREISPYFLRLHNNINVLFNHNYSGNICGKRICNMSKFILPNSLDEARYLKIAWDIPDEKINIIPNGVDREFYNSDPTEFKQKYGLQNFVLGVGSLSGRKNYDLLAEVCAEMDVPLVLIGDLGNSEKSYKIKKLAEENKNILLIPYLDHDSTLLKSAYAAADIIALPSDFETPGLVALEGALAGCKVLITKVGGTKDYFENYAYYVKPRSKKDIKNGLEFLLNKKVDKELKEHILNNFTWEKVAEKTYNVYKSVLTACM